MNKNQKFNKVVKYIAWKALGAFVFVAVAGTSIWALAAFTEPTDTPSNSVQDWAKNIMGANNSDNAFDSGDVVANSDGSMVERLEDIKDNQSQSGVSAIFCTGAGRTWDQSLSYCEDLSTQPTYVLDGYKSNNSTSYDDWKLSTAEELRLMHDGLGSSFFSSAYYWTAGESIANGAYYVISSGVTGTYVKTSSDMFGVCCVR